MSVQTADNIRHSFVVACFIFKFSKNNATPQVALFRRSDQVRTYQHHIGPISGGIEANESPIQAAWREINEETTLTPNELDFWRHGNPFTFTDTSVGRKWTIYSFGFRLKSQEEPSNGALAIEIDWEHESWAWYNPAEILDEEHFGGVPRLAESFRRVFFEIDMNEQTSLALQYCLQELKEDHRSGSHELTSIALRGFRDVLVNLKCDSTPWITARTAAWHIWKNGRESMGSATLNALIGALDDMREMLDRDVISEACWDQVLSVVDHHLEYRRKMPLRIKQSFVTYLQDHYSLSQGSNGSQPPQTLTLLTLSASSTIRDSILDAFAATSIPRLDLHILESRPLFEGASMASSIITEFQTKFPPSSTQSLNLTIHTDASAALASVNVDLVLLGADRISSSGSISNKTGSLPAVLSAKHVSPNVKVLVFSGLEKVAPDTEAQHEAEENDPGEVVSSWLASDIKGVHLLGEMCDTHTRNANCTAQVRNVYFEWVPADLIDGYICENGTLDRPAIYAKAESVRMKASEYFSTV
ncbi:uncharacterized protein N7483_008601 [Penicillium malachiteum]|uniref:uncharacterized protein n=1 Tax=Penicillium malachiteum TaxID=1324776 RepID=UPI002548097A|nr:uncharacterized protein N7483_008601 [Penicillium malachiteum]KAJ5720667.1 hypothetical protein N7483_008601 [Penicillium malachiteum]